jgi:glucosylceramidase
MLLRAEDEANMINGLFGSLMNERAVEIWAFDHNTDLPFYPYKVLESAEDKVQAVAWHCYAFPGPDYSVMAELRERYPHIPQFMTECANYKPKPGTYNFQVAKNFMLSIQNGASGATMWVMATNSYYGPHTPLAGCDGCLGSIVVDSPTLYTKTNDYYMIGQFSRFIRRGAMSYVISHGGTEGNPLGSEQFYSIAAQNPDQSWVVVFMNNNGHDQDVVLQFAGDDAIWRGIIPNGTVVTWLLPHQMTSLVSMTFGNRVQSLLQWKLTWTLMLFLALCSLAGGYLYQKRRSAFRGYHLTSSES